MKSIIEETLDELYFVIKDRMEKNIQYVLTNHTLSDSPFSGFLIIETINKSVTNYKSTLPRELVKSGIPEKEVEKLIDKVALDLHNKYIE